MAVVTGTHLHQLLLLHSLKDVSGCVLRRGNTAGTYMQHTFNVPIPPPANQGNEHSSSW